MKAPTFDQPGPDKEPVKPPFILIPVYSSLTQVQKKAEDYPRKPEPMGRQMFFAGNVYPGANRTGAE